MLRHNSNTYKRTIGKNFGLEMAVACSLKLATAFLNAWLSLAKADCTDWGELLSKPLRLLYSLEESEIRPVLACAPDNLLRCAVTAK